MFQALPASQRDVIRDITARLLALLDRTQARVDELMAMLEEEDLKDASLLVMANKQDMPGALNAAQISEALGLATIKDRQWSIQETSATKGEGLFEGFDWLVTSVKGGGKK